MEDFIILATSVLGLILMNLPERDSKKAEVN